MKKLNRILKLVLPAFIMRPYLAKRDVAVQPPPGGALARFVLAFLPFAFTAALSVRVESDRRPMKYFLPYGKMKKFVALAYSMDVGNSALDKGFIGAIRAVSPYGLVLWWDGEAERVAAGGKPKGKVQAGRHKPENAKPGEQKPQMPSTCEIDRLDKIEALTLRTLLLERARCRLEEKQ